MGLFSNLFGSDTVSETLQTALLEKLKQFNCPPIEAGLLSKKSITQVSLKKKTLSLGIQLPFACQTLWPAFAQNLSQLIVQLPEIDSVDIAFSTEIETHAVQGNNKPYSNVKNIIAVASGKGGVGKSTTSVNLALALQQEGAKVGILDADIYGPSIPTMLGVNEKPQTVDGESMEPIQAYGLDLMSVGFLIAPDEPMVWRGPLVSQTLTQLINETRWKDLDYLVIDLPPGTGDTQLTLSQQIPVTGSVIVTTPQEVSLVDARKGLKMFQKVNIPILGIIENMSTHICSNCGHEEAIFGSGGGEKMAASYGVELLESMPLVARIREEADTGKPTVINEPAAEISAKYRSIARQVSVKISQQRKSYAASFPNIVIENT